MEFQDGVEQEVARRDEQRALALGFHRCRQCEAWFHESDEGWADCVGCGRYCPSCAADIDWEWCPDCGLLYCTECVGGRRFQCQVCRETGFLNDSSS